MCRIKELPNKESPFLVAGDRKLTHLFLNYFLTSKTSGFPLTCYGTARNLYIYQNFKKFTLVAGKPLPEGHLLHTVSNFW